MISDLFVRYTTALDAGDVETIVGCFTEDGALESPAVGVMRDGRASANSPNASRGSKSADRSCGIHLQPGGPVGGDAARATCYLLTVITRNGKTELMPPGRYDCRLAKVDGQWLFGHRLVVLDGEFKLDGI